MDVTITNAATATSEEIPIELVRMLIAFGTAARVSDNIRREGVTTTVVKSIYFGGEVETTTQTVS